LPRSIVRAGSSSATRKQIGVRDCEVWPTRKAFLAQKNLKAINFLGQTGPQKPLSCPPCGPMVEKRRARLVNSEGSNVVSYFHQHGTLETCRRRAAPVPIRVSDRPEVLNDRRPFLRTRHHPIERGHGHNLMIARSSEPLSVFICLGSDLENGGKRQSRLRAARYGRQGRTGAGEIIKLIWDPFSQ